MIKQLIGGVADEQASEVEQGEHGAGATGVALILELQPTGERLLSDEPQDEEAQQCDQQQRGQALAGAREVSEKPSP